MINKEGGASTGTGAPLVSSEGVNRIVWNYNQYINNENYFINSETAAAATTTAATTTAPQTQRLNRNPSQPNLIE